MPRQTPPTAEPQPKRRGKRPRQKEWRADDPAPGGQRGAHSFVLSPFARFARAHGLSVAGDALVAVALADSFFFSIDPNDARWQVGLYLLLTVAPFGVVAPWLGPAMDRLKGGHRYMIIGSALLRALLAVFMALNMDNLAVFPLAFGMLVLGKTYHVAKSAMVPTLVKDESQLVLANSRLSIISSISAGLAGVPGIALLVLGDASWTMTFNVFVFLAAAAFATRIPAVKVAPNPAGEAERHELRGSGIILAASAMGYVRAVVGFLTMLLAFELRGGIDPGPTETGIEIGHRVREALGLERLDLSSGGAPAWHFGVVAFFTGLGALGGALGSPRLRSITSEERILAGALGGVGVFGLLGSLSGGVIGASLMAFAVATAGAMGKQSFDAIVQRDAPEANLGRSFARFESRFQLLWVLGAVIPVVIPIPARLGFAVLGCTAGFAAISYQLGRDPAPNSALRSVPLGVARRSRVGRWRPGRPPRDRTPRGPTQPAPPTDNTSTRDKTTEYALPPSPPPTEPPRRQ